MHFSCYVQVTAARAIINDNGRTEDTHAYSVRYSENGLCSRELRPCSGGWAGGEYSSPGTSAPQHQTK